MRLLWPVENVCEFTLAVLRSDICSGFPQSVSLLIFKALPNQPGGEDVLLEEG